MSALQYTNINIQYIYIRLCVCCVCVCPRWVWFWFGLDSLSVKRTRTRTRTSHARTPVRYTLLTSRLSPLVPRRTSRSRRFGHRRPAELYTYVSLFSSTSERAPVLLLPTTRTSTSTTTPAAARTAPTAGHTADPQTAGQLAYLHDTGGAVGQNAALCPR